MLKLLWNHILEAFLSGDVIDCLAVEDIIPVKCPSDDMSPPLMGHVRFAALARRHQLGGDTMRRPSIIEGVSSVEQHTSYDAGDGRIGSESSPRRTSDHQASIPAVALVQTH